MKVLITGAGGFVGQLLAEHLLNSTSDTNYELVLTDIFEPPIPPNTRNKSVKSVKADLSDPASLSSLLFPELNAIFVLHGIMSAGSEADFDLGYRVNLHSTMNLLEAVRKTCRSDVRVVYASSVGIFGQPLPNSVTEETTPTPQSSYGTQKAMIEYLINDYTRRGFINGFALRFPTISVRPGKPTAAASSFLSGIIREPLQGKESVMPDVGEDFQAWLCSPRTLARNLELALSLERDCLLGHVRQVNLPGITASVREMLEALREVGGEEAVKLVKTEKASAEIKGMLDSWPPKFDVSKALSLGFVADQSFKGAVEDFAASLKR